MVSKMISIARVNDSPAISGCDYFTLMTPGKDHPHSQFTDAARSCSL